ncbi:MAG: hypothetical protein OHK0046_26420 [Anaerolineae bacterium]
MNFLFGRSNDAFKKITTQEYHDQFFDPKAAHVLVDVRTTGEYKDGHLPGAINIPLDKLSARLKDIPKDKTVVMVCASGNRSASAAKMLTDAGYGDVYNLLGGTMRWMMSGLPVER